LTLPFTINQKEISKLINCSSVNIRASLASNMNVGKKNSGNFSRSGEFYSLPVEVVNKYEFELSGLTTK
jgi:hypothetical protein